MLEAVANCYILKEYDKLHLAIVNNHLKDVLTVFSLSASIHSTKDTDITYLYIFHKSNIKLKTNP